MTPNVSLPLTIVLWY